MPILIAVPGVVAMFALSALFGGIVLWFLWPVAVTAFPSLVASGVLASELSFWQAVAVAWVFAMLFKSTTTSGGKS